MQTGDSIMDEKRTKCCIQFNYSHYEHFAIFFPQQSSEPSQIWSRTEDREHMWLHGLYSNHSTAPPLFQPFDTKSCTPGKMLRVTKEQCCPLQMPCDSSDFLFMGACTDVDGHTAKLAAWYVPVLLQSYTTYNRTAHCEQVTGKHVLYSKTVIRPS